MKTPRLQAWSGSLARQQHCAPNISNEISSSAFAHFAGK
jgi:hypothetical protein